MVYLWTLKSPENRRTAIPQVLRRLIPEITSAPRKTTQEANKSAMENEAKDHASPMSSVAKDVLSCEAQANGKSTSARCAFIVWFGRESGSIDSLNLEQNSMAMDWLEHVSLAKYIYILIFTRRMPQCHGLLNKHITLQINQGTYRGTHSHGSRSLEHSERY